MNEVNINLPLTTTDITKDKISNTPYDDVFKTLSNDCPSLMIPLVNEAFDEHFRGDEAVILLPNEHYITLAGENTKEKITDSCFRIEGYETKKYHFECQSTSDNSMALRLFEYGSQIALDDGKMINQKLIVRFPHSAVIYLRHNKNTPDAMEIEVHTPGGVITYDIPVIKSQKYTIDELFEKNLLFLIPFYIFCYEDTLEKYENDSDKLKELQNEFLRIRDRLDVLCTDGVITEFVKRALLELSVKVIESIARNYEQVKKGVTSVMGGQILEYEAKTILKRGITEGRMEGKIEMCIQLIKEGLLGLTEAAKCLDMSEEELKKYL